MATEQKKFEVSIDGFVRQTRVIETASVTIPILAENEEEAKKIAEKMISLGEVATSADDWHPYHRHYYEEQDPEFHVGDIEEVEEE